MATEKGKQSPGSEKASWGTVDTLSKNVGEFLPPAPQFSALAKMAEEQTLDLSTFQQEFLDDFASRLTEELSEDDDASSTAAEGDGRNKKAMEIKASGNFGK